MWATEGRALGEVSEGCARLLSVDGGVDVLETELELGEVDEEGGGEGARGKGVGN